MWIICVALKLNVGMDPINDIPVENAVFGLKKVSTQILPKGALFLNSITLLPAIQKEGQARNWQFIMQGIVVMDTKQDSFQILMDLKDVSIADEFFIDFESSVSGTMILNNKVYSARKYIRYTPDNEKKTILFTVSLPCKKRRITFDMNFTIADASCWVCSDVTDCAPNGLPAGTQVNNPCKCASCSSDQNNTCCSTEKRDGV